MKLVQPWGRKGVMNYVFVYPSWSHINLLCGHTHAYTNIYILTYVHTYIHTCFLACLHTYIHTYLQVPFEEALELVRTRRVYLESGMAFVPRDEMISITVGAFRSRLSAALTVCVCVCVRVRVDELSITFSAILAFWIPLRCHASMQTHTYAFTPSTFITVDYLQSPSRSRGRWAFDASAYCSQVPLFFLYSSTLSSLLAAQGCV